MKRKNFIGRSKIEYEAMGWDGMGRYGLGRDGKGWDGIRWDRKTLFKQVNSIKCTDAYYTKDLLYLKLKND